MNNYRIESEDEVRAYLANLKYALQNGAKITFQLVRNVDKQRDKKYTNEYTIQKLFPHQDPLVVLRKELQTLTVENYLRTARDIRFPKYSEMREFGKIYNNTEEVYIKIRVELLSAFGQHTTFVMSFHFAEKPFCKEVFPYKKQGGAL